MKCVCGYKHEHYNYETDEHESNGDKEFIKLLHPIIRVENKNRGWHEDNAKDVQIYACPDCGTLKIDV